MFRTIKLEANFDVSVDLPTAGASAVKHLYTLDANTVAELKSIEMIGPVKADGTREKIWYCMPTVGDTEQDGFHFNELMCPSSGIENPIGKIDLGKPLLLGGNALESARCVKYQPSDVIGVKVATPIAAQGGAVLTGDIKVRMLIVEASGEDITRILTNYGTYAAGAVNQSVSVYDIETGKTISIDKSINLDLATLDNWDSLYGGDSVNTPRVVPLIGWGQNKKATTVNEYYEMNIAQDKVFADWQNFSWNIEKNDAIIIDKLAVQPAANSKETVIDVSERDKDLVLHTPQYNNEAPFPLNPDASIKHHFGPLTADEFQRGALQIAHKKLLRIMHKDNGTSIDAWSSATKGFMIGVWGYLLEEVSVTE